MLAGCVAVRLFDPHGAPLGYAGRRLDLQQVSTYGKWRFPTGMPRNKLLYGYHHATQLLHHGAVIVECPWGVLRLAQLAIPALALLGTHLSHRQQALLSKLPRRVLLMDGDKAGRNAARDIRQRLPRTAVVDLADGLDPDDLSVIDRERILLAKDYGIIDRERILLAEDSRIIDRGRNLLAKDYGIIDRERILLAKDYGIIDRGRILLAEDSRIIDRGRISAVDAPG